MRCSIMIKLDYEAKKQAERAMLKPKLLRTKEEQLLVTFYKRELFVEKQKTKKFLI